MKKILKFILFVILTLSGLIFIYLLIHHENLSSFLKNSENTMKSKTENVKAINNTIKDIKINIKKLNISLKDVQPVLQDLTQSYNQFMFKIKPRIKSIQDKINDINKIAKQANHK